jgi:RNA polymerase sigma factor for flagellar operon FliA
VEQRKILERAKAGLSEREQLVISLYYEQPQTMKTIATTLGVDESRVSQLHSVALVRLRKRVNVMLRGPRPRVDVNPVTTPPHKAFLRPN